MIIFRPSIERGLTQTDWLKSQHSFSFADYYDPKHMGFHTLRVINQDIIAPGTGFGLHPHKDMEIITYILQGAVKHLDSMGNETIISRGEIQRMSAGTGVRHGEANASDDEPLELLQIWLLPKQLGIKPSYAQMKIKPSSQPLQLVISSTGENNSLSINQDADIFMGMLKAKEIIQYHISSKHRVWLQMIKGEILLNDLLMKAGDGAGIVDEKIIKIIADKGCEFLLFDLA